MFDQSQFDDWFNEEFKEVGTADKVVFRSLLGTYAKYQFNALDALFDSIQRLTKDDKSKDACLSLMVKIYQMQSSQCVSALNKIRKMKAAFH